MILALTAVLAAAPVADVSPFAVKRLADGSLEYSYDLSAVKVAGGTPDAIAAHGDEKVKAFLKGLPRSMKVRVASGGPIEVSAARGVEQGRLATSFAGVGDGPMSSDNPLATRGGARLRPALDPDEPHLLLSAEAIAWEVRQLELSTLAAEAVDAEPLQRELWAAVLDRAIKRSTGSQGDAREGAFALSARVAAASACLDPAKVPAAARASVDLSQLIDAELVRLGASLDALAAPAPWSWRPELTCAWVRARALAQPFERSRAGTAAVLVFLDLLEKDARLGQLWERLRARRDRFAGAPGAEPILLWKEKTGGKAGEALETLNAYLERLPMDAREPPGLLAQASTPFGRFLEELAGPERRQAFAELATAVQDGRVLARTDAWAPARDAALVPFCAPEGQKAIRFDGEWRDRLQLAFTALLGGHAELRGGGAAPQREELERSELKVNLLVPPHLEVEPLPELFSRGAESLERLVEALQAEKLGGLLALGPDGQRGGPVLGTARLWIPRLKGLAALANPESADAKELAEARRLAQAWRTEPGFSRDVREASAAPISMPGERQHAAIVGVSRRELAVTWAKPPRFEAVGDASPFVLLPAEQRYIVPVLVSVGALASPEKRPLDRSALKALVDRVQRDALQAEGAFAEALK